MSDSQVIARTLEILQHVTVSGKDAPSLAGALQILASIGQQIAQYEAEHAAAEQKEVDHGETTKKASRSKK